MESSPPTQPTKVYSKEFWILSASSVLFFSSFSMILPELPAHIERMGGGEFKGWIIGMFAVMAGLSRPFSGKLADKIGRVPIIIFGSVVCIVCSFSYPFVLSVAGFLALRFIHGLSAGFAPTGAVSYIADICPPNRRGEILGMQTLLTNAGSAGGQAMGSVIANEYSLDMLFYVSSALAVISVLLLIGLKETIAQPQPFSPRMLILKSDELYEPRVLMPALIMVLAMFAYGASLTVVPDFSTYLGMNNRGLFFACVTFSSVTTRLLAGKASDIWGRIVVIQVAFTGLALSMIFTSFAQTPLHFLVGACFFGMSHGMGGPSVTAWSIDLAHHQHIGRALATTYLALEIGVLLGAFLGGAIFANQIERVQYVFLASAGCALLALGILIFHQKQKSRKAT